MSTSVISSAIKCYFSSFSAEDYGYKEVYDVGDYQKAHEEDVPEGGEGVGLKVEKGQKLTQKQLQMLEAIAEEKGNSTNPPCKEDQETFRCLKRMPRNKSNLDDDLYILGAVYTIPHICHGHHGRCPCKKFCWV